MATVTVTEKRSGKWLRSAIISLLGGGNQREREVWMTEVETANGFYDYYAVLEAYENLTYRQMVKAEKFLHDHPTASAAAVLARAACDASLYGDQHLNNTVLLYTEDIPPRADETELYCVIKGYRKDYSLLTAEEQDGIRACTKFALWHYVSDSNDGTLVQYRPDGEDASEIIISLADKQIKEHLFKNPGHVDEMLRIRDDNPTMTGAQLVAAVDGSVHRSLATGAL
jgi:hypothetical protein